MHVRWWVVAALLLISACSGGPTPPLAQSTAAAPAFSAGSLESALPPVILGRRFGVRAEAYKDDVTFVQEKLFPRLGKFPGDLVDHAGGSGAVDIEAFRVRGTSPNQLLDAVSSVLEGMGATVTDGDMGGRRVLYFVAPGDTYAYARDEVLYMIDQVPQGTDVAGVLDALDDPIRAAAATLTPTPPPTPTPTPPPTPEPTGFAELSTSSALHPQLIASQYRVTVDSDAAGQPVAVVELRDGDDNGLVLSFDLESGELQGGSISFPITGDPRFASHYGFGFLGDPDSSAEEACSFVLDRLDSAWIEGTLHCRDIPKSVVGDLDSRLTVNGPVRADLRHPEPYEP